MSKPVARPRYIYRVYWPRCTYRGVRHDSRGRWTAEIREPNRGTRLFLGAFSNSIEAAAAYDTAARSLYGPNAELNLPGLWRVHQPNPAQKPPNPAQKPNPARNPGSD